MTQITVNGKKHTVDVEADMPLLWVIRDELQLTGTKFGCGIAQCGACTVHVNGAPRRSCITPIASVEGAEITTIEGFRDVNMNTPDILSKVQEAWVEHQTPQCGYCQSGQIMSATALLSSNPNPSDDDIDQVMSGNICRCGAYPRIRAAIHAAAKSIREA
ncbi:MAG: isoquinoline 1-oxidoreductase alpha subunit [Cocleimonas sp.]|jgi:isoquinoline 1-oxidoreductase alpha subunit